MKYALIAAQNTARKYENKSNPVDIAPVQPIHLELDGETIGRLVTPTVSKIIAENLRRQRYTP